MKKSTETRGERERTTTTTTTFQLFDWHFIPPTSLLHSLLKIENKGGFSLSLEKKKSFSFLFVQFSTFLLALALLVASIKTVQKIFRLHFYSDKRGVSFFFFFFLTRKGIYCKLVRVLEKRERERDSLYIFVFPSQFLSLTPADTHINIFIPPPPQRERETKGPRPNGQTR